MTNNTQHTEAIRAAGALCREVAGEDLAGMPVYIVSYDEIRDYESGFAPASAIGWTGPASDLLLCDYLTSKGRWHGRGFATVVDCDRLGTFQGIVGAVLHELAHHLTSSRPRAMQTAEVPAAMPDWLVNGLITALSTPRSPELTPWHHHELPFVRAACHLAHRAERLMASLRPAHLQFATPYYPAPFNEAAFMTVVETEFSNNSAIRHILSEPAPQSLTDRWEMATQQATDTTSEHKGN